MNPLQSLNATPSKRITQQKKPQYKGTFIFSPPAPVVAPPQSSHWGKKNESPGLSRIMQTAPTSSKKGEYNYGDEPTTTERPHKKIEGPHQSSHNMQSVLTISPIGGASGSMTERASVANCPLD